MNLLYSYMHLHFSWHFFRLTPSSVGNKAQLLNSFLELALLFINLLLLLLLHMSCIAYALNWRNHLEKRIVCTQFLQATSNS